MKDDLISRQAALSMYFSCAVNYEGVVYVPLREIKDNLEELPSAQPGWIPVTERLPDGEGRTIVTTKWDDGYTVSYAYYWGAVGKWGSITDNVIAWMPLPKPWEGDANG